MNHRCMSGAQKAAIPDTFLQPYSVGVQLQTKAEDSSLIPSSQKAKEVEKQNWISHPILLQRSVLCTEHNLFARMRPAFPRFSRGFPRLQWAQSLRFVPGYQHWRRLMQPFILGSRGFGLSEQCCTCKHLHRLRIWMWAGWDEYSIQVLKGAMRPGKSSPLPLNFPLTSSQSWGIFQGASASHYNVAKTTVKRENFC